MLKCHLHTVNLPNIKAPRFDFLATIFSHSLKTISSHSNTGKYTATSEAILRLREFDFCEIDFMAMETLKFHGKNCQSTI